MLCAAGRVIVRGPDPDSSELVEGCQCKPHLDEDIAHTVELSHEIVRVHRYLRPDFTLLGVQAKLVLGIFFESSKSA
jgi:hypothetical protein